MNPPSPARLWKVSQILWAIAGKLQMCALDYYTFTPQTRQLYVNVMKYVLSVFSSYHQGPNIFCENLVQHYIAITGSASLQDLHLLGNPEGAQEYNSLEVSTTPVHLCVQV